MYDVTLLWYKIVDLPLKKKKKKNVILLIFKTNKQKPLFLHFKKIDIRKIIVFFFCQRNISNVKLFKSKSVKKGSSTLKSESSLGPS